MSDEPMLIEPKDMIAVAFDDHGNAVEVERQLVSAGWAAEAVRVLLGDEGVEALDASGTRHGIYGRAIRILQQLGDELKFLASYSEQLKAGAVVLLIPVKDQAQKEQVHRIVAANGGQKIVYFGSITMEELPALPSA